MATTTPNFGWPVPTSTDLVKDGATAMEALGDAIDTSMVDLKGGTTGQILSKATNADMDFTWIANDQGDITGVTAGTGISGGGTSGTVTVTNSMATTITTKGDLVPGTGSGTFARLAVGNNGETLVADSSTSTGLRYQGSMAAGRNGVINGGFDIWQRGTSLAGGLFKNYTADRWVLFRGGCTISRQATSDTTNLPFIQYCARVQRDSGTSGTSAIEINNTLATADSIPFAGKTVTVSFYARKGANYSATSSILQYAVYSGTGTDQALIDGFTGLATVTSGNPVLTTTWQRFTTTGTVATNATEIGLAFNFVPTGTAGAADYFEITGVQLEVGSVPTQFSRAGATIQGETSACMRYYQRLNSTSAYGGNGMIARVTTSGANGVVAWVSTSIPLRVPATSLDTGGAWQLYGTTATALTSIALQGENVNTLAFYATATGATANTIQTVISNNNTASYLGWSAEL